MTTKIAPYGSWVSPITAQSVAKTVRLPLPLPFDIYNLNPPIHLENLTKVNQNRKYIRLSLCAKDKDTDTTDLPPRVPPCRKRAQRPRPRGAGRRR